MTLTRALVSFLFVLTIIISPYGRTLASVAGEPIRIVVMDPLARPLSCDCVKGYAQRDYDRLGRFLGDRLSRPVKVVYGEDLGGTVRRETGGKVDLVIGKQSLVKFDAAECNLTVRPLAMLTGQDGKTTVDGLFVVPANDTAQAITDLHGYRILFGEAASAEKHAAAVAALRAAGVAVPEQLETRGGCSEAAIDAIESETRPGTAAVVSSYAMALLEGCGTIEKGELRVIGRTEPVPFVTVFATDSVDADLQVKIFDALRAVGKDPALLVAIESKDGFVEIDPGPNGSAKTHKPTANWLQWRGPRRDGVVDRLPEKLTDRTRIVWSQPLTGSGLAGIVADEQHLLVGDRDPMDQMDVFRCLRTDTGEQLWQISYPAQGDLDYGNSSRSAPVVRDGRVFVLGAFGDLHCLNLADGEVVWRKNLIAHFGAKLPIWGYCGSLLVVDDKLIVNPGAKDASLVALDPADGKVVWQTPGLPAAYSSFIVGTFGGVRQIVGYDAISIGGWDIDTGHRRWQLIPPEDSDFNVPTPINVDGRLLVTTENNGTRLYGFDEQGNIKPAPLATNEDLAHDTSTPVVVDGKVFGCFGELYCLDVNSGLDTLWIGEDEAFEDFVSIIASRDRLLLTSVEGELLLLGTDGRKYELISRRRLFGDDEEVFSHPALVGRRLYVRGTLSICCVELEP